MNFIQNFNEEIILVLALFLGFCAFWMYLLRKDIKILEEENESLKKFLYDKNQEFEKITFHVNQVENKNGDLREIKGIGDKILQKLETLGINSFKDLSDLNNDSIEKIGETLKVSPVKIQKWKEEALEKITH